MTTFINAWTHVVVISGAGFSAPSGLPVYRGNGTELSRAGWFTEDVAARMHATTYESHLEDNWAHWQVLAERARRAEPHPGHHALARWEHQLTTRSRPGSLTILTQNVDGLHQLAGSQRVHEVHGSILTSRDLESAASFPTPCSPIERPLRIRPDIVLFGERPRHMQQAVEAIERADLVIFAGTSGRVWPVAGLLQIATDQPRTTTMLLNLEPWERGTFDLIVLDDVQALSQLVPHT